MIAVDTNVLVRFLVRDDPAQARKAKQLISRLDADGERAFVSDIVLCEVVWVLTRSYRFERTDVADVLTKLVTARQLRFDAVDRLVRAVSAYTMGRADFADYLIRENAKAAGCDVVITFDSKLQQEEMFASP